MIAFRDLGDGVRRDGAGDDDDRASTGTREDTVGTGDDRAHLRVVHDGDEDDVAGRGEGGRVRAQPAGRGHPLRGWDHEPRPGLLLLEVRVQGDVDGSRRFLAGDATGPRERARVLQHQLAHPLRPAQPLPSDQAWQASLWRAILAPLTPDEQQTARPRLHGLVVQALREAHEQGQPVPGLPRRVVVFDATTGAYKRHWGAYGEVPVDGPLPPYDPSQPTIRSFRNPVHSVRISNAGVVYATDRINDRIQVFQKDGTYVTETFVRRETLGAGSTWDVELSKDPEQKWLFVPDGTNFKVWILDRKELKIVGSFGRGGRMAGQFEWVHNIAIDSKGNLYTTETWEGKRLQRFVNKGLAPVTKADQGTVWPSTR